MSRVYVHVKGGRVIPSRVHSECPGRGLKYYDMLQRTPGTAFVCNFISYKKEPDPKKELKFFLGGAPNSKSIILLLFGHLVGR